MLMINSIVKLHVYIYCICKQNSNNAVATLYVLFMSALDVCFHVHCKLGVSKDTLHSLDSETGRISASPLAHGSTHLDVITNSTP